jgi:2-polyprenyl-6-methoxyphenol hydroxylase-like FAD-dependent oxidoreductase
LARHRGTIEEKHAPAVLVRFFDQSFTICEGRSGGHILCYFIPGAKAATEHGARQLNWVWYVRVPDGPELKMLLIDKNGVSQEASVTVGMVPTERVAEVHALAARELHPRFVELVQRTHDPFIQAIIDVAVPRMALGRVCLVGDAAFVLRPHPPAATAKAAADAMALAAALKSHPDDPPAALREWEARQLDYGTSLARLATMVGKRTETEVLAGVILLKLASLTVTVCYASRMVFWTHCSGCGSRIKRTGNDRSWRCIRCQRQARLDRLRAINAQRKSEAAQAGAAVVCLTCGR